MKKDRGLGDWRRERWKVPGEREEGQRMTCGERLGSRRHCSGTWDEEREREREKRNIAQRRFLLQGTTNVMKISSCWIAKGPHLGGSEPLFQRNRKKVAIA